jgi:hypothetical protein
MSPENLPAAEPQPLEGTLAFEEGDFQALSERLAGDPEGSARRLVTRRKLLALGKRAAAGAERAGLPLLSRTSLHHPHPFNGMRVRRLWTYLARAAAEKKRLRGVLGAELGKDLDAAYRNAYLCIAIEAEGLEVSLRIHPDGWYDGQNLKNRVTQEGVKPLLALLNALSGFRLRLDDWKGEWVCGQLSPERLEEFFKFYVPGEHRLVVEERLPAPPGKRAAALAPDVPGRLVAECLRLLPLYRYAAWSQESDFLFNGRG